MSKKLSNTRQGKSSLKCFPREISNYKLFDNVLTHFPLLGPQKNSQRKQEGKQNWIFAARGSEKRSDVLLDIHNLLFHRRVRTFAESHLDVRWKQSRSVDPLLWRINSDPNPNRTNPNDLKDDQTFQPDWVYVTVWERRQFRKSISNLRHRERVASVVNQGLHL